MKYWKSIILFLTGLLAIYCYSKVHVTLEDKFFGLIPTVIQQMMVELVGHLWVARLLILILALYEGTIIVQLKKRETISWYGLLWVYVCLLATSFSAPRWMSIQSGFSGIPFVVTILVLLLVLFIAYLFQALKCCENRQEMKECSLGFIPPTEKLEVKGLRKRYAQQLVDRLVATDNDKESLAIVIYGSWGSGKTVFLNVMEQSLEDREDIVINFNPWKCNSISQIRTVNHQYSVRWAE